MTWICAKMVSATHANSLQKVTLIVFLCFLVLYLKLCPYLVSNTWKNLQLPNIVVLQIPEQYRFHTSFWYEHFLSGNIIYVGWFDETWKWMRIFATSLIQMTNMRVELAIVELEPVISQTPPVLPIHCHKARLTCYSDYPN